MSQIIAITDKRAGGLSLASSHRFTCGSLTCDTLDATNSYPTFSHALELLKLFMPILARHDKGFADQGPAMENLPQLHWEGLCCKRKPIDNDVYWIHLHMYEE